MGFSAWQEQWAKAVQQQRMLAAAGARLARPALAAAVAHWVGDWRAAARGRLAAQARLSAAAVAAVAEREVAAAEVGRSAAEAEAAEAEVALAEQSERRRAAEQAATLACAAGCSPVCWQLQPYVLGVAVSCAAGCSPVCLGAAAPCATG